MKKELQLMDYNLNNRVIDEISESVQEYMNSLRIDKPKILRIRLLVEEILLNWLRHFGENTSIQIYTRKKLGNRQLILKLKGDKFNPLNLQDQQYDEYLTKLSESLGILPNYSYAKGINQISFQLAKETNYIIKLFYTLLLAAIAGFGIMQLPESFRTGMSENVLSPIYNTFLGILSTVAGPMIFLSVAGGIYGIGDIETLGKIGKKMITSFFVNTLVMTLISMIIVLPLFNLSFSFTAIKAKEFGSIFQLLLSIFPKNIVSPFIDGNTMQIILMAVVVGCILLVLGNQTKGVAELIEQIIIIINYLMRIISKMVPGFIFIVILDMILKDTFHTILNAWTPIIIVLSISIIGIAILIFTLCIKHNIKPGLLIKKLFPSFLVGLTTSSSAAAFGTVLSCCENELGIDKKVSSFGVPLGNVLYKPSAAFSFVVCVLYFAEAYSVDISISWLIIAVVIITIISVALPPIPGGALACYTIIFSQLGIPNEAISVMLILDIIFDFINTGFDIPYLQCELVRLSQKLDMLDLNIIRMASRK